MGPGDAFDADAPPGWEPEETEETVRSWLGPEKRVVCRSEGTEEEWSAYVQPRGELGTAHEVPLVDAPTARDDALSAAREHMNQHGDG